MSQTIEDFAHALLGLKNNETEKAVAFMWFETYHDPNRVFTIRDITTALNGIGLITSPINGTRLVGKLKKHKKVNFDRINQEFTLPAVSMKQLNEEFEKLLEVKQVKVSGVLIAADLFEGTRDYLIKLVHEINGCFEYGFFDGSAILLRRLVEGLLIEVFIHKKFEAEIKKPDNSFLMLDGLLSAVKSGKYFRLTRNMDKVVEDVKILGDAAAHSRYHISTQNEFDSLKLRIGKLLSELLSQSDIKK